MKHKISTQLDLIRTAVLGFASLVLFVQSSHADTVLQSLREQADQKRADYIGTYNEYKKLVITERAYAHFASDRHERIARGSCKMGDAIILNQESSQLNQEAASARDFRLNIVAPALTLASQALSQAVQELRSYARTISPARETYELARAQQLKFNHLKNSMTGMLEGYRNQLPTPANLLQNPNRPALSLEFVGTPSARILNLESEGFNGSLDGWRAEDDSRYHKRMMGGGIDLLLYKIDYATSSDLWFRPAFYEYWDNLVRCRAFKDSPSHTTAERLRLEVLKQGVQEQRDDFREQELYWKHLKEEAESQL